MTIQEFILVDKHKVRRDSNLMSLYLEFFKTAFGRVPNCAGCSFGTDWQKLINFHTSNKEKSVTLQKGKTMNTISIKKIQGKILTYRKEGKTYRMYDNILTDSFIKEFASNGTEEEIKERLKMFNFPTTQQEIIVIDTSKVGAKFEEVKKTLSPDSTDEEINNAVKEVIDVIEVKPVTTGKKRGPKKRK